MRSPQLNTNWYIELKSLNGIKRLFLRYGFQQKFERGLENRIGRYGKRKL